MVDSFGLLVALRVVTNGKHRLLKALLLGIPTMKHTLLKSALFASAALVSQLGMAYQIDGSVQDWGVTTQGNANDWNPNSGVYFTTEDQTGSSGTYLNPGYGGQVYDAEAVYVDFDTSYMYYAVVTGLPQTGVTWLAGDISFDFGQNGIYEMGIEVLGDNGFTSGSLYDVAANQSDMDTKWSHAAYYQHRASDPVDILAGTLVGSGDLVYSTNSVNNIGQYASDQHYVIEGRIALSNFSAYMGDTFNVHWTMKCGNDAIVLTGVDMPTPSTGVPVPGTVALLGVAMLGMGGAAYRRRRQKA